MRFLVIDTGGLHVETARRIGRDGNEVFYFNPYHSAYTKFEDFAPGVGFPEITKILDFGPYLDSVDVIMFPDSGLGKFADALRKSGKRVFGAGAGEELELDRARSIEVMDEYAIKHPESVTVKGVTEALKWLESKINAKVETNQNATGKYYVKFDVFRGSSETFPAADMDEVMFMFDGIKARIGPWAEEMPIQIQKSVEGIECGWDCQFDGNNWVMPTLVGFESGNSYLGYVTRDMSIYQEDMDKIAAYLRKVEYRGMISTECFFDGKDRYYVDWTPRFPMPLGLLYGAYCKDFGKLVYDMANGKCETTGLPEGRYLGCMEVASEEALHRWLPIRGGKQTRFLRAMMSGEKVYSVPGCSMVAIVVADGDSPIKVQEEIIKNSEDLSVYFGIFKTTFVDDIQEKYLTPLTAQGLVFGPNSAKAVEKSVTEPKQTTVQSPAQTVEPPKEAQESIGCDRNKFEEQLVESCRLWGT